MDNFFWALGASIAVSLISLIGIFTFFIKSDILSRWLFILVSFSVGGLIGAAFLHLLPEALEQANAHSVFIWVIAGFIFFFILEKYLHWRHCHEDECQVHPFTYLNLVGDTIHNFSDGLIIGASFALNLRFGFVTTLAIILHEIPQELGDFGVLVYGGLSRRKALYLNFLTALVCVLGTVIGYFVFNSDKSFMVTLLPFIAGGFIYIAACDLVPELHKQRGFFNSLFSTLSVIAGISFILLATKINPH